MTGASTRAAPGPARRGPPTLRALLRLDAAAGAVAGVAMLALSGPLAGWYGLPRGLLLAMGAANLLYASYSGSLAVRALRPRVAVLVLVAANAAWAGVCVVLAVATLEAATWVGTAHLGLEALFVGALAGAEWRRRGEAGPRG